MITILKGRVLSGKQGEYYEDGIVAFENDTIVYAGEAGSYDIPSDAIVYEAGDGTIMPGMIDCHAHLTGEEDAGSWADGKLLGDQLLGAVYQLGILLDAGFTGLRDMSEAGLYLSRAVQRGAITGPRIVPGGKVLGMTSGHVDLGPSMTVEDYNKYDHLSYLCDGPDGCLKAVRDQFRNGAKFIKICATGGVSSPTDRLDDVQFSPEELKVIVEEAKRHHTYVTAHCTGYEGAYQAILAGVECIEHGVALTQREIDLMAEKNIPLVSTLWISLHVADLPGFPDWMQAKAKQCASYNRKTIDMARKAGIKIALGTDFSNSKNTAYATIGRELEAMVEAGMTNEEAIEAATVNAAPLMLDERVGYLHEGNYADIIITDGNPLNNISCLADAKHIQFVAANGKIVKNNL